MANVRIYVKNNLDMFKEKEQGHCTWSSSRKEMLRHRTEERRGQVTWGPVGGGESILKEGHVHWASKCLCFLLLTPYITVVNEPILTHH